MRYVDHVYNFIYTECEGMDSVYEDYILRLVGEYGLFVLKKYDYIESCGVVNGRQLYVLCDK